MAQAPIRRLIGRAALWFALALCSAAALFLLTAWIGSSIPRNAGWRQPSDGIEIMVETNGVHTALVLPAVTPERDWRAAFPVSDVAEPDRNYTHVSISWGEKEVFLNTPTWADLSPVTVLRILGIGGDGLLHVAHYVRPAPGADIRPLRLTREQYRRLVAQIDGLAPAAEMTRYPGYGDHDVFYDAPGRYTSRNTCNQWTSDTLAAAGVETGWWTPLSGGVMKWVPPVTRGARR